MTEKQIQVVVLGAGYAGLMAAIRLAGKTKKRPVKVTLVNAGDHFVERPRLHETATGNAPRQKRLAGLIAGTGIEFRQGYVTAFDPDRQEVTVETAGRPLGFSYYGQGIALGRHDAVGFATLPDDEPVGPPTGRASRVRPASRSGPFTSSVTRISCAICEGCLWFHQKWCIDHVRKSIDLNPGDHNLLAHGVCRRDCGRVGSCDGIGMTWGFSQAYLVVPEIPGVADIAAGCDRRREVGWDT